MSSASDRMRRGRWRIAALAGIAAGVALVCAGVMMRGDPALAREQLRVCSDPNNLPFSNEREEGFENALASLLADDLGLEVAYTWHPQRRGFVRNTLDAHLCDVVMGVPGSYELALPTMPYYRSTYVFVTRTDRVLDVAHLDDPRLRTLRIGVHVVGDDYSSTPGAAALGRRGIIHNLVGYSIYGNYAEPHPPSRLVEAVAAGDVDIAIAWGPLAGYFAQRQSVPLTITPVSPQIDLPFTPFVFDIAMAVRRGDDSLRVRLEEVLRRRDDDIRALLTSYGVPLVPTGAGRVAATAREVTR